MEGINRVSVFVELEHAFMLEFSIARSVVCAYQSLRCFEVA